MASPQFIVIAGANGSGKTTSARSLLPATVPFINADEIARELPESDGENKDLQASRLLLAQWDVLEAQRADFAIETTLASRSLVRRIGHLHMAGYQFHLIFFWLKSKELAAARVAERVRQGGHNIPEEIIQRRYTAGQRNLISLYLPLADTWRVYDNSDFAGPLLVATGRRGGVATVYDPETWRRIEEVSKHAE
jgi:predicted ABC-type ATPase